VQESELPRAKPVILSPGSRVADYIIERIISPGGCGYVYAATHRIIGRKAAIKMLRPEYNDCPEMAQRFLREAVAVNRIRHPNIVDIYDFGQLPDGSYYLVMELLEGTNLQQYLDSRGPLPAGHVLVLIEQVGAALSAAHQNGIVHRDVKAANVMVQEGDRVKLLDFGIAKDGSMPGLTTLGRPLGTPYAMAPEQIHGGAVDCRTDVYALGILIFHMLTGNPPFFSDDPREVERMHLAAPPPRPSQMVPTLPAAVDELVRRCLEKEPRARPSSVADVVADLRQAVRGQQEAPGLLPALGVLVDASLSQAPDRADEERLLAVAMMLEGAADRLRVAGFDIGLQSGTVLLGLRVVAELDHEADRAARERAVDLAMTLHAALTADAACADVQLVVAVHKEPVFRVSADVYQGPLLDVGRRTEGLAGGVYATAEVLLDIACAGVLLLKEPSPERTDPGDASSGAAS
jgi:serine/threonine-protein kinase